MLSAAVCALFAGYVWLWRLQCLKAGRQLLAGTPLAHDGRGFVLFPIHGRYGYIIRLTLKCRISPRAAFLLRGENPLDEFGAWIGLVRKRRVGESAFDWRFHVAGRDAAVFDDAEFRRLVKALLHPANAAAIHSLRARGGWLSISGRPHLRPSEAELVPFLVERGNLLGEVADRASALLAGSRS